MIQQPTTPPPVHCDVCGREITETLGGPFLDLCIVDLHDGSPVKDVCPACARSQPLAAIFPHILERKTGCVLRAGVEPPPPPEPEAPIGETMTISAGDVAEVPAEVISTGGES